MRRPKGRTGDRAIRRSGRTVPAQPGVEPGPLSPDRPIALSALTALPIEFVGSFPDPLVRLEPALPEVALIGRSNVGKSTLLNAFRLPGFYLVDLPGYGYARAGKAARASYRRLVDRYLLERSTLAGVVWLLDVRHQPSKDDLEMQELLVRSGRPVLVALTKGDKLTRSAQLARPREIAAALGLQEDQLQLTSSTTRVGIDDLAESILAAVGGTG